MHLPIGASSSVGFARALPRRGAVAIYTALFLVLLIGFTGLMLDTARVRLTAQELQRTAEAAAMAGVPFLDNVDPLAPLEFTYARDTAQAAALANNAAHAPVILDRNVANLSTGDIVAGYWDYSTLTFVPFALVNPPPAQPPYPTALKVFARKTTGHANGTLPLVFGSVFGSAQSQVARSAIATRGAPKDPLIFILANPNVQRALNIGGSADLNVQSGVVQINSGHNSALTFTGNSSSITASRIQVHGGSNKTIPNLVIGAPVLPDPLAAVPFPSPPYTPKVPAQITVAGTYPPGFYPQGIAASSGTITLSPGVFIFGAPGIDLTGNVIVKTGLGTTICLLKKQPTWSPGDNAVIKLQGGSRLEVTAPFGPGSGAYEGVAIFMQLGNGGTVDVGGNGSLDIKGFLYSPSGLLDLGGTSTYSIGGIDVWAMKTWGSGFVTGINLPPGSGPPSVFLVE